MKHFVTFILLALHLLFSISTLATEEKSQDIFSRFNNYSLSYKAGIAYDFDVSMEVEMTKFEGYTVPKILRYKGNWNVIFKKRERAIFTATLFDFKK